MRFSKIIAPLVSLLAPTAAVVNSGKDQWHYKPWGIIQGPSMWIFGEEGLKIYSPDGSTELKSSVASDICHNITGYSIDDTKMHCDFYDVVSDGKKYVWAAVSRGVSKINVFDINTGTAVGSFETCSWPWDLDYHPLREEMWVRCRNPKDEDGGYMDVISTTAPTGEAPAKVMVTDDITMGSWGYTVVDNSLSDMGYTTARNQNKLFKVDLSERVVLDTFDIPLAHGSYEVAFSKKNKHIFVRVTVCCTCGFSGADKRDCGRMGSMSVTVTTGPYAGQVRQGQCGQCDGVAGVDTLGVYEFDTSTDTFVGNHLMPEGVGGDPYPSPDGSHIVMVGRNGGKTIRVLETGEAGEKSKTAFDLKLGFEIRGYEESAVFNDLAFVQTWEYGPYSKKRNMIVIASGTENKIALVDISGGNPTVDYVTLTDSSKLTASNNLRQVEWVHGTPYVWVDGNENSEVYVIDVDKKKVVKTISRVKTTRLLSVENYEMKHTMALVAMNLANGGGSGKTSSLYSSFGVSNNNNGFDMATIISLVVGGCALLVGLVNIVLLRKVRNITTKKSLKPPGDVEIQHMQDLDEHSVSMNSLGSKRVT